MILDITSPAILVPSGRCPHMIRGTSSEDVMAWVKVLRSSVSEMLTKQALKYWVRHSYGIFTDEHKVICMKIDKLVKEPRGYATIS
jgi:ribosomal protein L1